MKLMRPRLKDKVKIKVWNKRDSVDETENTYNGGRVQEQQQESNKSAIVDRVLYPILSVDDDDRSIHTVDTVTTHQTATEFLATPSTSTVGHNIPTREFRGPSFVAAKCIDPLKYEVAVKSAREYQCRREFNSKLTRSTMQSNAFWAQLETSYETDVDEIKVSPRRAMASKNIEKNYGKRHDFDRSAETCEHQAPVKKETYSPTTVLVDDFKSGKEGSGDEVKECKEDKDWLYYIENGCDAISVGLCGELIEDVTDNDNDSITLTLEQRQRRRNAGRV